MKIQRWKEKLFSALVDQKDSVTNERFIEAQSVYYYLRMDIQDLITAGGISDIKDGYLLWHDTMMPCQQVVFDVATICSMAP